MEIKVLGPGCPKCQQTEKNVKEAVAETGVDAKVDKVTNLLEIAKYGVFGTPASGDGRPGEECRQNSKQGRGQDMD